MRPLELELKPIRASLENALWVEQATGLSEFWPAGCRPGRAGSPFHPFSKHGLRCRAAAISIVLSVCFALTWPTCGAIESGVYQTLPGATVEERAGTVSNSRVVPLSATLTFNLSAAPPSLTAMISNAVLEWGDPFALTVRSSSGAKLTNDTYLFSGDYLRDIEPSGTQYLFDWRFSTSTNGSVVWNGITGWAGGHIWQVTISNITLVPIPRLDIVQAGSQVTLAWPAPYTGYTLEQAASLSATNWSTVTNTVATTVDRFSVTVEAGAAQRFFRLRKF
jgi:hypothetical protein